MPEDFAKEGVEQVIIISIIPEERTKISDRKEKDRFQHSSDLTTMNH